LEDQNARKVNAMLEQKEEMVFKKRELVSGSKFSPDFRSLKRDAGAVRVMAFQKVNVSLDQSSLLISGL
jgi:hypothetical protein